MDDKQPQCSSETSSTGKAPHFTIRPVRTQQDLQTTVSLFNAYTSKLGIDLTYQDYNGELAQFPGFYGPPHGELLIAVSNDEVPTVLGCIALRPLKPKHPSGNPDVHPASPDSGPDQSRRDILDQRPALPKFCEIKRLYVTPSARGLGVGKALVRAMLEIARRIGYEVVRLDTLPDMLGARAIYKEFGFDEVEKYYDSAIEGTVFLGLRL